MDWKIIDWRRHKNGERGEILKKNSYRCGFCAGTGFLLSAKKGIKCPVCSGNGNANVLSPAVICAYCNGTGRAAPRTTLTCTVCRGKGVVGLKTSDIELCSECKGYGRKHGEALPCLKCKGIGVALKALSQRR